MKKPRWKVVLILFFVGLFFGYALLTAFFPAANQISKPLLCAGEYRIETTRASYRPGEPSWTHTISCDGKDITLPSVAPTGMMTSLVVFAVLLARLRGWVFQPAETAG